MNYNKVIKDLKERNDKLQEQYRLRDIRCIHLEYENEMLKSDFEAQHELTKKYAEELKQLKEENQSLENQQKEFLNYLKDKLCIANKVLDDPEEDEDTRGYVLARKFMLEEILSKYQEIMGVVNNYVKDKR